MRADVIHRDEHVVAFKDINPRAPLHALVIPRAHVESLNDLDDPLLAGRLALVAAKIARDAGYADRGFRVVSNSGADAGQSVPHLHFHVLAGRSLGWPPG
jgi:histidine triad (HIT) family protein